LSTSDSVADRICFKRIKAIDILDTNNANFDIKTIVLEEDKSLDMLDDEQFPGMV
jgi:hypothetical protein